MRILYVIEYFHPYTFGGAEESTLWQAHYLNQHGHSVSVLTPNYGEEKKNTHHGVDIYRFPFFRGSGIFRSFIHKTLLWHVVVAWWILVYTKKLDIDVVHVQGKFSVPGAILARMVRRIPVVTTLRDYAPLCQYGFCLWRKNMRHTLTEYLSYELPTYIRMFESTPKLLAWIKNSITSLISSWQLWIIRKAISLCDHVVYVSKATKAIYDTNGLTSVPSTVIYNMAPRPLATTTEALTALDQQYDISGKRIILFVGKLSYGKGADMLLRTVSHVTQQYANVHYVFAGTVVIPQDSIRSILSSDSTQRHVTFLGRVSQEELARWYIRATLVTTPSLWQEPFSRVGLEALAYHKPLITSRQGGFPEMLHSVDGAYMVDVEDTERYASTLVQALKHPKPTRLPKFLEPEHIIDQWENFYQNIIDHAS